MTIINRLSSSLGHRDNVPNQELAKELAKTESTKDIEELVQNLSSRDKAIQNDCLKVLYEIGYINPKPIALYVMEFCNLLRSQDNRMDDISGPQQKRVEKILKDLDKKL